MPDSSAIDNALVTKLGGDATLLALMPNGAYFDVAPPGSTRFVIVSLANSHDESMMMSARAFEEMTYLIKAVGRQTPSAPLPSNAMKDAAARIDALLDDGTLTVPGYALMVMRRVERIRVTEVDETDESILWQHRGGMYEVLVSPA